MNYDELLEEINKIEIACEEDLEKIEDILNDNNIQFEFEIDEAYDSCGYEVWYYVYAFVYEDKLRLITGTWDIY